MFPLIRNGQLTNTSRLLYRATLRILLVLLHDFPEFLSGYHHSLVDLLPSSCIQLRNLILSAFPPDMRLPDPFTPNLKVDLLPEINQAPKILTDYTQCLIEQNIKQDLDHFLANRGPTSFLNSLAHSLLSKKPSPDGSKYDTSVLNALVLYVGTQAIAQAQESFAHSPPYAQTASMDIFQGLLTELDHEGFYC